MIDLAIAVDSADHAIGPAEAPVTIVEYGDYECPDCGRAFPIINRMLDEMDERLRFVFRHFPLSSVHPNAAIAAQAAEAAAAQGRFWEMHNLLYENQDGLGVPDLMRYALRAGLEVYRFNADMASERFARIVKAHYDGGVRSGVKGTPTLFINGRRYAGSLEFDALTTAARQLTADQHDRIS